MVVTCASLGGSIVGCNLMDSCSVLGRSDKAKLRRLSVTNYSSESNFADVSTECSSRHQGEKAIFTVVVVQFRVCRHGSVPGMCYNLVFTTAEVV